MQRLIDEPGSRSREEQDLLCAALARLDPEKGHAFLEESAGSYPFFGRERAQRLRTHAIAALGELGGERAEAILKAAEKSARTTDDQAACRAALERLVSSRGALKVFARRRLPESMRVQPSPGARAQDGEHRSRGE